LVDTVKVALVAPAATVTLVGTVATAVLLLASATIAPPADADALKVTVSLEVLPAVTLVGLRLSDKRVIAGLMMRLADFLTPLYVAEIVTAMDAATGLVEIVNAALVAPAGTVTLAGTVATVGLLLESATITPLAGAAVFRVTVPIEAAPPVTLVGLRLNAERVVGFTVGVTVSTAELVPPPEAAQISTL
jgi:hypothetical protein